MVNPKEKFKEFLIETSNLIARIRSKDMLQLTVRSRREILFEGQVRAISSINEVGVFDVLPQHANFITVIKDSLVILKSDKEQLNFAIKTGLLKVWENEAQVFIDVLSPIKFTEQTIEPFLLK